MAILRKHLTRFGAPRLEHYSVEEFYNSYGSSLGLELIAGENGLKRPIKRPEVHRPGLALSGFLKDFAFERVLVFGNVEILYLEDLDSNTRTQRLQAILKAEVPLAIVAGKFAPPPELIALCAKKELPLFRAELATMDLLSKMTFLLADEFAPQTTCHGTFIEAYGVGVLIQGDSSIGKSEAALSLIERGHRLISDDAVRLHRRKDDVLEGTGPELTRHMMEIRGIGIINVAHIYGAVCVRDAKTLDLIVKLEEWNDQAFYDRVGLDEQMTELLGVNIPYHVLPVKPGRDVALLIETIVLNHRLKLMGYHSAREFNAKLLEAINRNTLETREKSKSEK